MSNEREPLRTHENYVDYLPEVLTDREHYFLRSKVDRSYLHYIGNKYGKEMLVSPCCEGTGGTGGTGGVAITETPAGDINGVNTVFTTSYTFNESTVEVYVNGLRQAVTLHYTLSGGNTITFTEAPEVGDVLQVTADAIDAETISPDRIFKGEIAVGTIDGINTIFTVANDFVDTTVGIFINGFRQLLTTHYILTGTNEITYAEAPEVGDILQVDYIKVL